MCRSCCWSWQLQVPPLCVPSGIPVHWLEKLNYRYAVGMLVMERRDVLVWNSLVLAGRHKMLPNRLRIWDRLSMEVPECWELVLICPPHLGTDVGMLVASKQWDLNSRFYGFL